MEVINVLKSSKIKVAERVFKYCGGNYSKSEAVRMGGIGIGRMNYEGGIDLIDDHRHAHHLKVNFETLKEGLGIYLRSTENHYVILIRYDEMMSISIEKEMDEVRLDGFSFFKPMMKQGINYWTARKFLLDKETVAYHDAYVHISTEELDSITLKIARRNPQAIADYFNHLPVSDKVSVSLETYTLVD